MKLINNKLYLTFTELTSLGIAKTTLTDAKLNQRDCWSFITDPSDHRAVLIEYESLKDKYKALVVAKYGDPYKHNAFTELRKHLRTDAKAYEFYSNCPTDHRDRYTKAAEWLNLIIAFTTKGSKDELKKLGMKAPDFWQTVAAILEMDKVYLPYEYTRLVRTRNKYLATGYECLITKKDGNNNARKITPESGEWLIARFANPVHRINLPQLLVEYNERALGLGLKPLKSEQALYTYLYSKAVIQKWYGARYGELKAKEKFGYKIKTILPSMRDALWYSDGTKFNYYDAVGKLKPGYIVYEVIDVYSEVMLGYCIARSENYEAQYHAFKMAIQYAGQKPYELRYDNQGGHNKLNNEGFLDKLARLSLNTKPYNGSSKTIEALFGHFQQQIQNEDWYYTGQNITARKASSRANMEFIVANQRSLPTIEELTITYELKRTKWNNGLHSKYNRPRAELYQESVNPACKPVDYLEMVELFWLTKPTPITYFNHGITVQVSNEKYEYEVLKGGMPDKDFRRKYIDAKFIVKYDPMDMSHIRLYVDNGAGLEFIAEASPRITVKRAIQEQEPGHALKIRGLLDFADQERIDRHESIQETMAKHEMHPENYGLVYPKIKGVNKAKRDKSLGEVFKEQSLVDALDNETYEDLM